MNNQKYTTIKEVAQHAGVSVGTVSRVLNGAQNIDPKIHRRTMRAIDEKGYRPRNQILVKGAGFIKKPVHKRTGNIGVLFYNSTPDEWRRSQIFQSYIEGVESACSEANYHPLFEIVPTNFDGAVPRCLVEGKVNGVLLKSHQGDSEFIAHLNKICPVVLLNCYNPSLPLHLPQVAIDNLGAGACATQYLIDRGHRRIAFINVKADHSSFAARVNGYVSAMKTHGLYRPELLIEDSLHDAASDVSKAILEEMEKLIERFMHIQPLPTAVLFSNDWVAHESYGLFTSRGLDIGRDISIVGFDNSMPLCELANPPLTSFALPFRQMAKLAAKVLIDRIEQGVSADELPEIKLLPGSIQARDSVSKVSQGDDVSGVSIRNDL